MGQAITDRQERRDQSRILRQIENWLETPMFVLSLLWAVLLVIELVWGLSPILQFVVTIVWIVFIVEFVFRFVIAPKRILFLRRNLLTMLALVLPALRLLRVTRVMFLLKFGRGIRGLTMARVLTAFNRGLRSLKSTLGRFGFGYVIALTLLVTVLGAAGMYAFERDAGNGLRTFGDALWFTAMLMTTSGSDYWPTTLEGRILCFLLALYAFAIFGYVTATLASLLVGSAVNEKKVGVDARAIESLRREIAVLNELIAARENS